MLSLQFIAQNIHFANSLFAALVFFAVFWLYFDAWLSQSKKLPRDIFKWAGFLLVAASFVVYGTLIEQTALGKSIFGDTSAVIANALRIVGYIIIIAGQLVDPLMKRPSSKDLLPDLGSAEESEPEERPEPKEKPKKIQDRDVLLAGLASSNGFGVAFALPVGALAIAALYWRRATTGIERHLKPVAYAYAAFFLFEICALSNLLRGTTNPALYDLVKAFGPVWIAGHIFLLVGTLILGYWVWHYLVERFFSQLFMVFTSTILVIFLLTTVSFTFLLLGSIQNDSLSNLETATHVLGYALDSKKAETEANAQAISVNPAVIADVMAKNHAALATLTDKFLETKKQTGLVITNDDAQVLIRAEDPERWGDSISSDTLVRRALIGTASSTVVSQSGVLAPVLSIRSVVPVRDASGTIIGTVSDSLVIDNSFVDGIKAATGLDSTIYSGNTRSATTLTAPDGTSRWVGVKETSADVQSTVLKHGQTFKGTLDILNRQYLAVYAPLKDADNTIIGMLFIGQPEVNILQTTAFLVRLTFIVASILLVFAVIPAYLVARYIAKQLE